MSYKKVGETEVRRELEACFELARKLRAACDRDLTDPDSPEQYTLDPRAEEISVVYDEPTGEVSKSGREIVRRKRASLQYLLNIAQDKLHVTACSVEVRRADLRELLLKNLTVFDKHLRMLGDLTGAFKLPGANPEDIARREEEAHKKSVKLYWMEQRHCQGRTDLTLEEAEIEWADLKARTDATIAELERLLELEGLAG